MTTRLVLCVLTFLVACTMVTTAAVAWPVPSPPGGGLKLYVEKTTYRVGEPIRFMLYKHAGVDDMPANLEGSYYIIESRQGGHGREFYTSNREPLGTKLSLETERIWSWDQKDNERTHKAKPGQWRLRFYAPKGNVGAKPLEVHFRIE